MKSFILSVLVFFPFLVFAQLVDTAAVRQEVDSLIALSLEYTTANQFEEALRLAEEAEGKVVDTFGKKHLTYAAVLSNYGRFYSKKGAFAQAENYFLESKALYASLSEAENNEYVEVLQGLAIVHEETGRYEKAEALYQEALSLQEKVSGKDHPDYADLLSHLGGLHFRTGRYESAESLQLEARDILQRKLGPSHTDFVTCIFKLAVLYERMGRYGQAEALYVEMNEIWKTTPPRDQSLYGYSLNNLGFLYYNLGRYQAAEPIYLEAREVLKKSIGEEHPNYAYIVNNTGMLYKAMGRYKAAENFYLEAMALREKTLGKAHPYYAMSISDLGQLYVDTGRFEEAEMLLQEAVAIREKALGKEHYLYALSLNLLGYCYQQLGEYERAESLALEAGAIHEKTLGKDHPQRAYNLINLGNIYSSLGKYELAESYYLEAKTLRQKTLGRDHAEYAHSLNNLAALYTQMGNYKKAESLYQEARSIWRKTLGEQHSDYAISLGNLAELYGRQGKYAEAEPLYLEALSIKGKNKGKEHPDYALILSNLANLYQETGNYDQAESLYLEARAIQEKVLGTEHPEYATSLSNLGQLYEKKGQFERAESSYLRTLSIRKKVLGNLHAAYAYGLNDLATMYCSLRTYEKAEPLHFELFQNLKAQIDGAFRFLSESEKENFINSSIEPFLAQIQSAARHIPSPDFQDLQYDISLLIKGLRLQAGKSTMEYVLKQQDPGALDTYYSLLGVRRRLAKQLGLPLDERRNVEELETQQEELEKELARQSATFRREEAAANITQIEVKAALKAGEAAIEFVHFNYFEPDRTDSVLYAAVVLLPDADHARFIPLFEEKQLNALLVQPGLARLDYVDQLYTSPERGVTPRKEIGNWAGLYDLIWLPLDSLLEDVTTIYYSPSGLLHRINLGAIPSGKGTTLADKYQLHGLSSTRLLALATEKTYSGAKNALIYGGIRYDFDSTAMAKTFSTLDTAVSNKEGKLHFGQLGRSLRGDDWNYLEWTAKESDSIFDLLSENGFIPLLQKGYQASEESFKQLGLRSASPRILHLSTHGFFFPEPVSVDDGQRVDEVNELAFQLSEHPMIRSGLVLAGANRVWQGAAPLPDREDGILTAYEISQLNLTNTELVVLSACETGLGDIRGNEGVFGLQRAFKMAGARYLIMSLWQVPDFQTQDLMVAFYTNWLQEGMTIPDAFHRAQQEMRNKYRNPYFWAGFVLVE